MPLFTYTIPLPVSGNNPSVDQPNMTTNNASVNSIIGVDHFSFNDSSGGLHKQSTYVDSLLPLGTSISISAGQVAFYGKTNGQSQVMATSDAGANEYQMTRFIDADFALFATDTVYPQAPPVAFEEGGWTFLPGGLLLQYGSSLPGAIVSGSSIGTTKFPIAFTSVPFSVILSPVSKAGGADINNTVSLVTGTLGNTSFGWNWQTSTSKYTGFHWIAIGI